jgi:hypothetical protein
VTYPYLGVTPRFYSQYLAGNGKPLWGIPGGTYIMTAVPGSGADLAGAAAIPPTDGRWGALSGAVTGLWPAVTAVGTPATAVTTTANATGSVTGTWSGTQPRTFGDLLIACVTSYGDAGIGTTGITETSGTWARQGFAVTVGTAASIFVKVAGGGDAAPTFAALMNGTVATTRMTCFLIELTGLYLDGSSVAISTFTGTTGTSTIDSATVSYATSYAISCWNMESLSGTPTWTPGSLWTNVSTSPATAAVDHAFVDVYSNPPVAALQEAASMTVVTPTHQAAVLAVVSPITTLYTMHGEGDPSAAAPPGDPPVAADPFPMPGELTATAGEGE